MQRFVDRFKAKASKSRQANSRMKMIEKIELPDIKQTSRVSPNLDFQCKRPSGKELISVKGICKKFAEKTVLENITLKINRHEKVAIIGHNGIGKSTLLKIMLNLLAQDKGEVSWGYETQIAYFAQDHHEALKQDISVLDWLSHEHSTESPAKIRHILGQVLFTKDDVEKNILNISFITQKDKLKNFTLLINQCFERK